ncbi:MAG: carboxymuconolactone decarboxylase family protein [Actinomycetota bacterium]
MARIDVPDGEGLERERLLMMQLDVAMGMGAYSSAIYEKTSLAPRVREVARLRIAAANGCPVCLNTRSAHAAEDGFDEAAVDAVVTCELGGVHTLGELDECERLAGEFADRFATDHHRLDDAFMSGLRDHFTDVEIIELTALCAMTLGNGRFFTVLGVEADDDGHYYVNEGDR